MTVLSTIPERHRFKPYKGPTPYAGLTRAKLENRMEAIDAENGQLKKHMGSMKAHYKQKLRKLRQEGKQ